MNRRGHVEEKLRSAGCREARRGQWTCPAHPDHDPSLSVDDGEDDRVLLHCHAGCTIDEIMVAAGIEQGDISPPLRERATVQPPRNHEQRRTDDRCTPPRNGPSTAQHPPDCTLESYATAKRLPLDFLANLGVREVPYDGGRALRIPYLDEAGEEVSIRFRQRVAKLPGGDGRFKWRSGSKAIPYGLWRVNLAQATDAIVLVEGESDCHVLWLHGIPALGIPGANNWKPEFADTLDGIGTIFAVRETDAAGSKFIASLIATPAIRDRLRIVALDTKDVSDLHLRDPDRFEQDFATALDRSTVAIEEERIQAESGADAQRKSAWESCAELAASPQILERMVARLRNMGAVGEERAAKLIYLALTSRVLPRPVSVVVKGPSSAGKSWTTDNVLRFFPASAYYALSGMSERFLVYDPEPLSHRMIVVSEAAGLVGDFATYLVRTLLSEGRLIYGTVTKNDEGEIEGRRIEKPGPTGVILTTTQIKLHPENETRLFSVPVDDTAEQTQRVLFSIADGSSDDGDDLAEWHSLQDWIALGESRVVVPFARTLAGLIDPVAVRLRRDFGALLALIRTHALLHRASRETTAVGVIATVEDYAIVRELIADLIAEAAQVGVAPAVRATVEIAGKLIAAGTAELSITVIAKALEIDKSSASRRVRDAIEAGYLANREDKKGKPARIVLADTMPAHRDLLPDPEALRGCEPLQEPVQHSTPRNGAGNGSGCSVAVGSEGLETPPTDDSTMEL